MAEPAYHGPLQLTRVPAQRVVATVAERKRAKLTWPPVRSGKFVLFVDDLNIDEYAQPVCEVRMIVNADNSRYHR
jgi:hypothetical protein